MKYCGHFNYENAEKWVDASKPGDQALFTRPPKTASPLERDMYEKSIMAVSTKVVDTLNTVLMRCESPLRINAITEIYIRETSTAYVVLELGEVGLFELGTGEATVAGYTPVVHNKESECRLVDPRILQEINCKW